MMIRENVALLWVSIWGLFQRNSFYVEQETTSRTALGTRKKSAKLRVHSSRLTRTVRKEWITSTTYNYVLKRIIFGSNTSQCYILWSNYLTRTLDFKKNKERSTMTRVIGWPIEHHRERPASSSSQRSMSYYQSVIVHGNLSMFKSSSGTYYFCL